MQVLTADLRQLESRPRLPSRRWKQGWMRLLLALATVFAAAATEQPAASKATATAPTVANEYQIKAVFLYNFTKYVEWPAATFTDAQAPFVIGVLGDSPFGSALDEAVQGEKVNGHPVVIRRFSSRDGITGCQILFITQAEVAHFPQILADLKGHNVLTVGDADDFTDGGGMVGLVTQSSKVRLKINLDAAKAANLTINSNLLRAAEVTGHAKT